MVNTNFIEEEHCKPKEEKMMSSEHGKPEWKNKYRRKWNVWKFLRFKVKVCSNMYIGLRTLVCKQEFGGWGWQIMLLLVWQ